MASRNPLPQRRAELPERYRPIVAGYARGPLITAPDEVRPSEWRWRNARTYVVRHLGHDYRAVRLYSVPDGAPLGYWAVELLGVPLPLSEWE